MKFLLVDNGSLRAESVLNLRRVAAALSARAGMEVIPASLLHSSKIPSEELDNVPAVNLERRLRTCLESGEREFTLMPFFFGPTGAILDYLPARIASLHRKYGEFKIQRTAFLFDESCALDNDQLLAILADNIRTVMTRQGVVRPRVALVDHGSPLRSVTAVRDTIAHRLQQYLGDEVEQVSPASMERRPGTEYAFNEPLLENLLLLDGWSKASVIVSMLFLSPGRHAGPGGDVASICANAAAKSPGLVTHMTDLVGTHPLIVELLATRLKDEPLPLV